MLFIFLFLFFLILPPQFHFTWNSWFCPIWSHTFQGQCHGFCMTYVSHICRSYFWSWNFLELDKSHTPHLYITSWKQFFRLSQTHRLVRNTSHTGGFHHWKLQRITFCFLNTLAITYMFTTSRIMLCACSVHKLTEKELYKWKPAISINTTLHRAAM